MRVFVTGSTGFIGSTVVRELLAHGHQVLGLTRSDKGVAQLEAQGAEVLRGTIEDTELLKKAATTCDAVAHLAFVHDFANFAACCATDRAAITALGSALAEAVAAGQGDRALVVTSGTMMLKQGQLNDEDTAFNPVDAFGATRGPSEGVCLDFAKKGVRASIVRLPPTTHGDGGVSGFMGAYIGAALKKGSAPYVGDGAGRWSAGHRDDAAVVYRLALEKGAGGSVFHAVTEEGVTIHDIAEAVGRELKIPAVSITADQAKDYLGIYHFIVLADNPTSGAKTRARLGWEPKGPTALEDVPAVAAFIKGQGSQGMFR